MKKFIIMGLPRSGTTYLMTLLNSHPNIVCHGEMYNPYAIIEDKRRDQTQPAVVRRDANALRFFKKSFENYGSKKPEDLNAIGFKFMIGHNIDVLRKSIASAEDITLIYVHRDNKLAQAASLFRALETKNWAQTKPADEFQPIEHGPMRLSHRIHEMATMDFLFAEWFAGLGHAKKTSFEYRELFASGFEADLCDFIGVPFVPTIRSPLAKQGSNLIIDRFAKKKQIRNYFTKTGHEDWLGEEL